MTAAPEIEPLLGQLRATALGELFLGESAAWLRRPGEVRLLSRNLPSQQVSTFVDLQLGREGQARFAARGDVVVVFEAGSAGRFRLRATRACQKAVAIVTAVPDSPPPLPEIGIPAGVVDAMASSGGIVVLAGPARSGLTTTRAALLQAMATYREVVSVENPVEIPVRGRHPVVQGESPSLPTPDAFLAIDDPGEHRAEQALDHAEAGHRVLWLASGRAPADVRRALVARVRPERRRELLRRLAGLVSWMWCQRLLVPTADRIERATSLTVFDAERRRSFESDGDDDFDRDVARRRTESDWSLDDSLKALHREKRLGLREVLCESLDPHALAESLAARR